MSIVEKAAEKLKTSPAVPPSVPPETESTPTPAAASTVERLQERARAPEQPAQPAQPPPMWNLDASELRRAGLLPFDGEAERRLDDELRGVKRPLLANAVDKSAQGATHGKRIMVTSAEAGEGKTFIALNLALSLARETDFEVLLVDGDIPKSDITRILGLDGKLGLMDVLADERRAPSEAIVRTNVSNLLVVPAGARHPLAAELFRGRRMEHVLDEFSGRNRRRLMVFDSSPLLATSESQVLASHMGQVVLVVAASRTRRQAVSTALRKLDDLQYVGLLLNMSRQPPGEDYYKDHGRDIKVLQGGS